MRGRMNDARSYAAPQPLGEVMTGGTVGEVVATRNAHYGLGEKVALMGGWQLFSRSDGRDLRKIDADGPPIQSFLGVLGMPGVTAWYGLHRIIAPKEGETVVVSAATGAVGAVVGQLAKVAGARVVGIAGGATKCSYAVDELGYDHCVDHRAADFAEKLAEALPRGIDGLFENVGGVPFAASIRHLNVFSRIAVCGLVASGYDGTPTPLPDMRLLLDKRAKHAGIHHHRSPRPLAGRAPRTRGSREIGKTALARKHRRRTGSRTRGFLRDAEGQQFRQAAREAQLSSVAWRVWSHSIDS